MCGRYAATLPPEMMIEIFKLFGPVDMPPRYNIRPTDPILGIREKDGQRTARLYRWGLIPGWVREVKDFPLLINARADTMLEKPAFRDAVKWGRCVIPADGYYEWMTGEDGSKHPYFITTAGNEPMVFAGLYAAWRSPQDERIESAAIVTVDSNLDIAGVHDRMPAILEGGAVDQWLDVGAVGPADAATLATTPPSGALRYHRVSRDVGRADAEGPDLVRPITAEEAVAEGASSRLRKQAAPGQLDLF